MPAGLTFDVLMKVDINTLKLVYAVGIDTIILKNNEEILWSKTIHTVEIEKVDKNENTSFANVVRQAVNAFDNGTSNDDSEILNALADTMINTAKEVVNKMAALEKQLDTTHAILEKQ